MRELQEKLEDATKYLAIDMQEGLYLVSRYEKKPFRGQKKTTLFLLQLGDDGNPKKKDADEPVWRYFLQQRQTKKYRAGRRVFVPQSRKRENNSADEERHTGGAVFRPPCVKIYTHSQLLEQRKTSPQLPTASIGPYGHFSHSDAFSVVTLARIARPRPKFSSAKFCKVAQSSTNCFEKHIFSKGLQSQRSRVLIFFVQRMAW